MKIYRIITKKATYEIMSENLLSAINLHLKYNRGLHKDNTDIVMIQEYDKIHNLYTKVVF